MCLTTGDRVKTNVFKASHQVSRIPSAKEPMVDVSSSEARETQPMVLRRFWPAAVSPGIVSR